MLETTIGETWESDNKFAFWARELNIKLNKTQQILFLFKIYLCVQYSLVGEIDLKVK